MPAAVADPPVVPVAAPVAPVAATPAPAAVPAPASPAPAPAAASVPAPKPADAPATKPSLLDSVAKPADAKPDEKPGDAKPTDAKAADPAPAEIVLKAPEGVEVSAEELKGVTDFAKAQGLTQKQAEAQLGRELAARGAADRAQAALMTKTLDESRKSFESDPDYGGPKLQESLQSAKRGLDFVMPNGKPLVPPELKPMILQHFGDSAPVLKFLTNLGSLMREDQPPGAGNFAQAAPKSDAQLFYPQHYKK